MTKHVAFFSSASLAALLATGALDTSSALGDGAVAPPVLRLDSPLGGVLPMEQAISAVHPLTAAHRALAGSRLPPSSVLPNVQASVIGTNQAQQSAIVVNPYHPALLMSASQDFNCSTYVGLYFSADGGATWTGSCLPLAPGASSGYGEPALGWALNATTPVAFAAGLQYFPSGNYEVVVARSRNRGSTWSIPVVAAGAAAGSYMDRPWLEVDENAASPFRGHLYVSATRFNTSTTVSQISVSHSSDGGQTWSEVNVDGLRNISTDVDVFSNLAIGADGVVYVSWMRCLTGGSTCAGHAATMYVSKSLNGGKTWSHPRRIHSVQLAPASCASFYGCLPNTAVQVGNYPAIAVDTSGTSTNGRLYVIDYSYINSHMTVRVTSSGDGGVTWGTPVGIATTNHDQFFPWISVSAGGVIGASWLDRRKDPSNHNYDAFAAVSTDGGATFGTNARLSTVSSDPGSASRMGEYTGNAWTNGPTQKLMAAWTDSRTGVQQDEVGGLIP
ncbi:MAG TPA: sialidase family protein [Rhizomicrobium sp.]